MEKKKAQEILKDENYSNCPCLISDCKWHGNCKDCVSLHRYHATIPECLKEEIEKQKGINIDFINEKAK